MLRLDQVEGNGLSGSIRIASNLGIHMVRHITAMSVRRILGTKAEVVSLIGRTVQEQVRIADERIARGSIWTVKHASFSIHLGGVQTRKPGHGIVNLAHIEALKVVALPGLAKTSMIDCGVSVAELFVH